MTNAKQRVENIKYRIEQAEKLLNSNDKTSDAYKHQMLGLQGLRATLRVAESSLRKEIRNIKGKITRTIILQAKARNEKDKNKCEKSLKELRAQLEELT